MNRQRTYRASVQRLKEDAKQGATDRRINARGERSGLAAVALLWLRLGLFDKNPATQGAAVLSREPMVDAQSVEVMRTWRNQHFHNVILLVFLKADGA